MPRTRRFHVRVRAGRVPAARSTSPASGCADHSSLHGADVMQCTYFQLQSCGLQPLFGKLERVAALTAAGIHDVAHPGVTNGFLVATRHELAVQYNDMSPLENMHCATGFRTLWSEGCDWTATWKPEQQRSFRRLVVGIVLATDLKVGGAPLRVARPRPPHDSLPHSTTRCLWTGSGA